MADIKDRENNTPRSDAMYTTSASRSANVYARQAAATRVAAATPHELIAMLFDGLQQSLLAAKGAIERGDVAGKGAAIGKAVRILDEGLRAALDPQGGELTERLQGLYDYGLRRLTEANLRNDADIIEEVRSLLEPVADAWNQIRPQ